VKCTPCNGCGWTYAPEIDEPDVTAEDLDTCTACTDGIACDDGLTPESCDRHCYPGDCERAEAREKQERDRYVSGLADNDAKAGAARCKQLTFGE